MSLEKDPTESKTVVHPNVSIIAEVDPVLIGDENFIEKQ
jgi:hypothetical protein